MKAIPRIGALLLVLACAPAHAFEDVDGTFKMLGVKQQATIRELLDLILADGPASRVKQMRMVHGERACGQIDAKNGNDQYLGFRPFLVDLRKKTLHVQGEGQSERYRREQARMERDCGHSRP